MIEKPPLGMISYLPSHNHHEDNPCAPDMCPYGQWEDHIRRHGNPYPRLPYSSVESIKEDRTLEIIAWLERGAPTAAKWVRDHFIRGLS